MDSLVFTFKLGKKEYEVDLAEDLAIGDDPRLAMQTHAETYAKYALAVSKAKHQAELAKTARKKVQAEIESDLRSGGIRWNPSGMKITEGAIETCLQLAEPFEIASRKEAEANYIYNILWAAQEAMNQRKEMMQYMGADDFSQQMRLLTSGIHEKLRQTIKRSTKG